MYVKIIYFKAILEAATILKEHLAVIRRALESWIFSYFCRRITPLYLFHAIAFRFSGNVLLLRRNRCDCVGAFSFPVLLIEQPPCISSVNVWSLNCDERLANCRLTVGSVCSIHV